MAEQFFTITDIGDAEPWALVRVTGGLYERWVTGGVGWVDTPYFVSYFMGGEIGSKEVTAAEAKALQDAGIGSAGAKTAELMRGKP